MPLKQFTTILAITLTSGALYAQDLADNNSISKNSTWSMRSGSLTEGGKTAAKPANWERQPDEVNGNIARAKLVKMKNQNDSVMSLLQETIMTDGGWNPVWHGVYFGGGKAEQIMRFGVQCDFPDKSTQLTVITNDIGPLTDHLAVADKDYLLMTPPSSMKNDCFYFDLGVTAAQKEDEKATHSRVWLVTNGKGTLPYTPVSKREYLENAKMEVGAIKQQKIAEVAAKISVRPKDVQEAEKKAAIDEITTNYTGADQEFRMKVFLKNYQSDEDYLKANAEKATADLDSTLSLMEMLLHRLPAAELNQPAMVSVLAEAFQGFEDLLPGSKMLVKANPAYYDPYLSGEKAQLFLVYWNYDPKEPMAATIDQQLQEKFDSGRLKAMLGK